ncbi:heavy metal-responsive transcriptional regulator [Gloeocapsopsis dulcis]|uniref:Heavy metal-responsive transcriptional regulator n=1 Tax=Gloeocapsopsis dulcis AAB1 = 1H9 TaxID=1433147 RepID=A0A6N8FY24_9CHRO|nr:heavy metal-responsive transcriptional regulator [Gloeocapsopsis dulcis]MUL37037.1 heavy metal-responsive transcriptional regulator [Gloeocapsopsis dulcis AAB1 = 1H9]WNN87890.1 heavy metal-responsive transcriptional regulator [Gloeocapsopsis dulcis]
MLTQDKKALLIGQVTALSGIPIRTIRYYESLGLLQSAGRTEGGFRQFSVEVLTRLSFIKRAQSLGLSLEEIGEILNVHDHGELPCGEVKEKLVEKVAQIDHQVKQLLTLRAELNGLLSGWEDFPNQHEDTICPNIQKGIGD